MQTSAARGVGRELYSGIEGRTEEGEESCRRLMLPGRGVLADVAVLREYRRQGNVWRFGDEDEIVVDVTTLRLEGVEVECEEPGYGLV